MFICVLTFFQSSVGCFTLAVCDEDHLKSRKQDQHVQFLFRWKYKKINPTFETKNRSRIFAPFACVKNLINWDLEPDIFNKLQFTK